MKRMLTLFTVGAVVFAVADGASAKNNEKDDAPSISISTIDLHGVGFDATVSYDRAWSTFIGTPTLDGDSLVFGSAAGWLFASAPDSAPGPATSVSPSFSMFISATNGNVLDSIRMGVNGSYELSGANTRVFGEIDWRLVPDANGADDGSLSVAAATQKAGDAVSGLWNESANWTLLNAQSVAFTITPNLAAFASGNNRTASIGLSQLDFGVSIAPVPEPETYLMMLAGLGIVGAVARRRSVR